MRIVVEHRTRYRFTQPQTRLIQLLRLTPDDSNDQTVISWSIEVDCDARLRHSRDGLGNRQAMLYAEGPLDEIEISVRGEVLTGDPRGMVQGTSEPLPPEFFLRDTDRTLISEELAGFARRATEGGSAIDRVDAVMRALRQHVRSDESGEAMRDAGAAFESGSATHRELAQILVAGLRAIEIPARYVSGYRQRSEQACAPHGWVEAFASDGWYAVDPSVGAPIDERYIRVAVGLDTASAAPVAGSRLGEGEEVLDVALRVNRADAND